MLSVLLPEAPFEHRSVSFRTKSDGRPARNSSAQPLNRTDREIVDSPSRLLAAVPRFLMVAKHNRQRAASDIIGYKPVLDRFPDC
jgi:hypothetical protein